MDGYLDREIEEEEEDIKWPKHMCILFICLIYFYHCRLKETFFFLSPSGHEYVTCELSVYHKKIVP